MNFDEAVSYLLGLGHETIAIKFGLENIERLLGALEDPQKQFLSVQIAGTNGKGSTASMLDAICDSASVRRGLYTSPHLVSITERIRINGRDIDPEEFAAIATLVRQQARRLVEEGSLVALPSFFEHLTAMALVAFRRARVALAILETGLGGRLDATTAARASVAGIAPVSMDHQEYLGHSLAEIAAEKAAIIHSDTSAAVIAPQKPEALAVILRRCSDCGITPSVNSCRIERQEADSEGRFVITFETSRDRYDNVRLGLRGRHQAINASLAVGIAEALCDVGLRIDRQAIMSGLENARHPGRLELFEGEPRIILDGAHNVDGALALAEYLEAFIHQPLTIIFGAMRDKNVQGIMAELFVRATRVVLTEPNNARAAALETLVGMLPLKVDQRRLETITSPSDALKRAREVTPKNGVVCIAGSLYLVGEIRKLLLES